MCYQSNGPCTGNMRSLACRNERSGSSSNTLTASGLNPCLLQVTGVHWLYSRTCCISESLVDALGAARKCGNTLLHMTLLLEGEPTEPVQSSKLLSPTSMLIFPQMFAHPIL